MRISDWSSDVCSSDLIGVVASITPWNSSLLLTAWKLGPALCAGNTIICKPSEFTTTSLLVLAGLAKEAGIPAGVINVLTGFGAEVGEPLIRHPDVDRKRTSLNSSH